jgi:coproporphyrinogen III oxidase-like Fe-S oxidoreductase
VREWAEYRRRSEAGQPVQEASETLTGDQIALEDLYLGLRTDLGVPVSRVPEPVRSSWCAEGWAEARDDRLALTPEGWLRLDALVASLTRR